MDKEWVVKGVALPQQVNNFTSGNLRAGMTALKISRTGTERWTAYPFSSPKALNGRTVKDGSMGTFNIDGVEIHVAQTPPVKGSTSGASGRVSWERPCLGYAADTELTTISAGRDDVYVLPLPVKKAPPAFQAIDFGLRPLVKRISSSQYTVAIPRTMPEHLRRNPMLYLKTTRKGKVRCIWYAVDLTGSRVKFYGQTNTFTYKKKRGFSVAVFTAEQAEAFHF